MSGVGSQDEWQHLWPHEPGPSMLSRQLFSVGVHTSNMLSRGDLRHHLRHHHHLSSSSSTIPFSMSGVGSQDEWRQRPLDYLRTYHYSSSTIPFSMSGVGSQDVRPESMMSMQSDRPMELLRPVKLPDPPSRQVVSPLEPGPHLPLRQVVLPCDPGPHLSPREDLRHHLWHHHHLFPSPPRHNSNPEKEREGSPAPSSGSMKRCSSMDPPVSFKRTEEEREAAAKRREIRKMEWNLWPPDPGPSMLPRFGFSAEEERAVSPASSCESMKSDRSKD